MMKKKWFLVFLFLVVLPFSAWAEQIEVRGLKRLPKETLLNYLPKAPHPSTQLVIQTLYQTGFFEQVRVSRQGGKLVIDVRERPLVAAIRLSGNSDITSEKLKGAMNALNVMEGRPYSPVALNRFRQGLLHQYHQMGHLNAEVNTKVTPLEKNRVQIQITISEGSVTKINRISIIGNKAFSEREIIKNLNISTPGLLTILTQEDRFSEEKLQEAVERIKAFYLDHGYLHVSVTANRTEMSSNKQSASVQFVVEEGSPYTLDGYFVSGNIDAARKQQMEKALALKSGEVFSRKSILEAQKRALTVLGEDGYVFATINVLPEVNEQTKRLRLNFVFELGKKAYVRKIQFSDNYQTNDYVLRRAVRQMEMAPVQVSKLERGKQKINLLPYIRDVDMTLQPVPGSSEQVDVNYRVKEADDIAQATFRVGYSQLQHVLLAVGLNHKNIFGTGNSFSIDVSRSRYEQYFGVAYTNPYWTDSGISRSFNFSIDKTDPQSINQFTNVSYSANQYTAGVSFGIPLSEEDRAFTSLLVGANVQDIRIKLNADPTKISGQVSEFINVHGDHYTYADVRLGVTRDARDRSIFPTSGTFQSALLDTYLPLRGGSPGLYTLDYQARAYYPLTSQFILTGRAQLGYGNAFSGIKNYPFFKNFYAGGFSSVHAYEDWTLGARDSLGKAFGGNVLAVGSVGLIFPNFVSENLRTMAFVDAGNAFSRVDHVAAYGGKSQNSGPFRYSAGIQADWMTPIGPVVKVSLAKAIKKQPTDATTVFQFSFDTSF